MFYNTVFVGCVLKDLKRDSARHFVEFACTYFGPQFGAKFVSFGFYWSTLRQDRNTQHFWPINGLACSFRRPLRNLALIIRSLDSSAMAIDGIVFDFQRSLKLRDGFTLESRKSLLMTTW